MDKVEILAFGAHPDDVEIGMGGTIAKHTSLGYKTAIVDLTRGELSTNGTVEQRLREAEISSKILGLYRRDNLGLQDRNITVNPTNIRLVVDVIRKFKPDIVAMPYWEDPHPDHENCARLVKEAVFSAGLIKFKTEYESHKVKQILYYFINETLEPSFLVDVSRVYDRKIQAIYAYESQFIKKTGSIKTALNDYFVKFIKNRDGYFGSRIATDYAEGFIYKKPRKVDDLTKL
jgi:bacillithiol biosynthesis deacetylase BshB1